MKFNIKNTSSNIFIGFIIGILLFFVTTYIFILLSGWFFKSVYIGLPLEIIYDSTCEGIKCTASPVFNWLNVFVDLIFWICFSYLGISSIRTKIN